MFSYHYNKHFIELAGSVRIGKYWSHSSLWTLPKLAKKELDKYFSNTDRAS